MSVRDYQREIAEIDQLLALGTMAEAATGPSFARELSEEGLRYRREVLSAELAEARDERMPGQEIDVALDGAPVVDHTVDAAFLGVVLHDLQNLVRDMVADQAPRSARTGPLRRQVVRQSALRVAGTFNGSFGIRLESVNDQLEMEGSEISPMYSAFDSLLGLINGEANEGAFLDSFIPLGSRSKSQYRKLLRHLSRNDATIRVEWPTTKGVRAGVLRPWQAKERLGRLRRVKEQVSGKSVTGVLSGAVTRTGYFELETEDEEYFGKVHPDIMPIVATFFQKRCSAYITTTVVEDEGTGDRKVYHRLDLLGPPDVSLFDPERDL